MGLDLRLCVDRWPGTDTLFASRGIEAGRPLANALSELTLMVSLVPANVTVYDHDDEAGLQRVTEDPYGTPLTWMEAGKLVRLVSALKVVEESWEARAALAYLREIPPDLRVLLWWH